MISDREQFFMLLLTAPLLKSDAVVVLCGEDGIERTNVGVQLMRQGSAPYLVLSGGINEPPKYEGYKAAHRYALGQGIAPSCVVLEKESKNTREQALNVVNLAIDNDWHRLLLVASPYHMSRAFLTFLAALREVNGEDDIRLLPVPAAHLKWSDKPADNDKTRIELLDGEVIKTSQYGDHCATYKDGVKYLLSWEGK